jgi:ribosome-binding protein aMBF1 (putative translation factor)
MTFEKFVCWNLEKVRRVMDVEATQPQNHIFLATHYPIAMYREELIKKTDASGIEYDEQKFIKDFLAEEDFTFVPVLGKSGTGKSHLIRWLKANIKSTDRRKVLLIPKIGTNLKDIISLILAGMEGEKFDEYRQRVNRATNTLTETQARVQLLNQLAAAVGDTGKRDRSQLTDEQEYLVNELDSLLYDPFFREYWLKDGGIIHRLFIHILGYHDKVEIVEERRQFSLEDLPLDVLNLQKAGKKAQEFYAFLIGNDSIQKATVHWLNQHLDEAITQVLNLGREDLLRLIREVRESLAEEKIELVLLIEDFAKLQGIDREVLEAILARPQQPGNKSLCAIRTALACTTGYFEGLISTFDTIQQRVTFSVYLDIDTVRDKPLITKTNIQEFVSRYLNAVRLEDGAILDWANSSVKEEDDQNKPLISACNECEHRQACHKGFGEINGIGLYPFNDTALQQMLTRVNLENFNPRILIKDVLKYTLEKAFDDIKKGRFPAESLSKHFGSMRLGAMLKKEIEAQDPQNYDRRQILIDLWTDSEQICDLSSEIHTAFNLPSLGINIYKNENNRIVQTQLKEIYQVTKVNTELSQETANSYTIEPEAISDNLISRNYGLLAKKLKILDDWNNQAMLAQDISQELRVYIFAAIENKIEWDTEMLLKGYFVGGGGKIFQRTNIVFHSPKKTKPSISGVILSLPLNPDDTKDFRDSAIAFQAILQYNYYKNWKFPDGDRYFRIYIRELEKWSQYVLEGIRCYPRKSGEAWNPAPAAVELLAISATMAGHSTNSLEDVINSLFLELENNDDENRASSWKQLFKSLKKYHNDLLEIVQSRIACTKGASTKFQIIDTIQIIESLEQVRKSWQPQCEIPEDIHDNKFFKDIYKARQQVDALLEQAIQEEYERQLDIYQRLVSELGEDIKKKDVIDALKAAMEAAQDAAVFRGKKGFEGMTTVLDQFRRTAINPYRDTMKRVQTEKENPESNIGKLLQYLSEDYQKIITDSSEFLDNTNNFLDASILEAKSRIAELEKSDAATVESSYQEICEGLASLRNLMNEIKGNTKCS